MPDPKKGLHPFHYAIFGRRGIRLENVTFYAESQKEADSNARAWATSHGQTVKRRVIREARES